MSPCAHLPRVPGRLRRVVEEPHDAHGIVGGELAEDAIAVGQALGEHLEHLEGQLEDGRVVGLGGLAELGDGEARGEDVLAQQARVCLGPL